MWVHAEAPINDVTGLRNGELALFIRLGSDIKNNYYEYEIPLTLTPPGRYADTRTDREAVWPLANRLDLTLQNLVNVKKERNHERHNQGSGISFTTPFSSRDPENEQNIITVLGNPSLSDVRVMMIGIRNNSATAKGELCG